jgi:queuine/archaeosine tRNA-ribosyltransferase
MMFNSRREAASGMADVYIVYSSKNVEVVSQLVALLSMRWDVSWDDTIVGDFAHAIETEIPKAKCMVAIWSAAASESTNVHDELLLAKQHGVPIISASVEECTARFGFIGSSITNLKGWTGEHNHPGLQQLLRRIASVVPPRSKPVRATRIAEINTSLPALFLSVSSHETQLTPLEAVKVLRLFHAPSILVSAYDLVSPHRPTGILKELRNFRKQGGVVLVDSGNYEASRRRNTDWKYEDLHLALQKVPHDLAFCFDVMKPSPDPDKAVKQIIRAVKRDQRVTLAPVLPIVHAPPLASGGYLLDTLPTVIRKIAEELYPKMIAVPERELGPGLVNRARTMRNIRMELDKLPFYQPVHLLGTGNPWSVAVLLAAGADSFDGLEWCRMVVDRQHHRLNHFQHFDFFTFQAEFADSAVTRAAIADDKVDFAGKVAFHNLDYFMEFSARMQETVAESSYEVLVTELLGGETRKQLNRELLELFK